jgi:thioredoxin 1
MSEVQRVASGSWDQEVLKADGLVMIDFWAPWCGPCKMIAPIIDELALEYTGKVKVMKLNTDENPDISGKYQIMGIPSLLFFKGGKLIEKLVGAMSKKQFKDAIDRLLA